MRGEFLSPEENDLRVLNSRPPSSSSALGAFSSSRRWLRAHGISFRAALRARHKQTSRSSGRKDTIDRCVANHVVTRTCNAFKNGRGSFTQRNDVSARISPLCPVYLIKSLCEALVPAISPPLSFLAIASSHARPSRRFTPGDGRRKMNYTPWRNRVV